MVASTQIKLETITAVLKVAFYVVIPAETRKQNPINSQTVHNRNADCVVDNFWQEKINIL